MSAEAAGRLIALRRAGPLDAGPLTALHAASFPRGWDEAAMAQFLCAPSCVCLVGSSTPESPPRGFLIARLAGEEAEILTFAVVPESRRQGLGRALLEAAIASLRAAGAKQLFLEVGDGNDPARNLYQAFGAVKVGKRKAYYGHGADASIFCLAL